MLTDKTKQDFKQYFLKNCYDSEISYKHFLDLRLSMQYGVLVDFFDSEEIHITLFNEIDFCGYSIDQKNSNFSYTTVSEARTKAIEKANQLYNENYN